MTLYKVEVGCTRWRGLDLYKEGIRWTESMRFSDSVDDETHSMVLHFKRALSL